jgi:glycosyltransferase involved in cell wall biosynthesis
MSVVVCTHNRAGYLGAVLDALSAQTDPPAGFEVILVDNASTDDTSSVAAEHPIARGEDPAFRYVFEPTLGLSAARNRGVNEAAGEIVAFLDDDAIPAPRWAAAILHAFDESTAGAVGGRVNLRYEAVRPEWLTPELELYLTRVDWDDPPGPLDLTRRWVAGANIAFRRSLLCTHQFDPDLGRTGESLLSGEEIELCRRLGAEGWSTVWAPDAVAEHLVPARRATLTYLRERAFAGGKSAALANRRLGEDGSALRTLANGLAVAIRAGVKALAGGSESAKAEGAVATAAGLGMAREALGWLFDGEHGGSR